MKTRIKKSVILCLLIICFSLFSTLTYPITDQKPSSNDMYPTTENDLQSAGWGVYPVIPGFYDVADWEIAVCMYYTGPGKTVDKTFTGIGLSKDYPGQVDFIDAYRETTYDPDTDADTNLYTVCWGVIPFEDSVTFNVILKGDGSPVKVTKSPRTAQEISGDVDCDTVIDDKIFTDAAIVLPGNTFIKVPVVDKETGNLVTLEDESNTNVEYDGDIDLET
ncbi:hypothetical protein HOC35_01010 [Candidatus Woesearchaeota archaeon]|nr:hypothetical protein [Candidatus Woesearchaeota archaeon]